MSCPLKAKFQYIDRLPRRQSARAAFGSCVHHALEVFERTRQLDDALQAFAEAWDDPSKICPPVDVWPAGTTWAGLNDKGQELLRAFAEKEKWERTEVLATEYRFNVPFGKHDLVGVVDRLEIKKDRRAVPTLRVVDYKCLDTQAPVVMADGRIQPACAVQVGDLVIGERRGVLVPVAVEDIFDNGIQDCVRVATYGGRTLDVTTNHPFLTSRGWVKAEELQAARSARALDGDLVAIGLEWRPIGKGCRDVGEAWLLGALIGDGHMGASTLSFTNIDPHVRHIASLRVEELGFRWSPTNAITANICNVSGRKSVRAWREKHGLYGLARDKRVPEAIMTGSQLCQAEFLSGYLATDGSVRVEPSPAITWHSVNRDLLADCQQLLAYLGIKARIEQVAAPTKEGHSFRLVVSDRYGVVTAARVLGSSASTSDKARRLLAIMRMERPERPENYAYDPVKSVERLPARPTIGLKVEDGIHLTGGMLTHNTNSRVPYKSDLRLNVQFTCYDFATRQKEFWVGNGTDCPGFANGEELWRRYADLPRRGIWWALMQNKEVDCGERTDDDFLRLYRVCNEIEKAIKYEVFVPDISGETCTFCDFTKECRLPFEPRLDKDIESAF